MDLPVIHYRLKVFISSSMSEEQEQDQKGSFHWRNFRKKVKDELNSCPYINAFTIEDFASTMPSKSFMLKNVDASDIVVLLIKNEIRDGTRKEYERCIQNHKPLLVFFFEDKEESDEVIKLRESIENKDYCNYIKIKDFLNAEKIIENAVIQDVIFYYQSNQSLPPSIDIDGVAMDTTFRIDSYIPTKEVLSQFESCYKSIYEYIGLPSSIRQLSTDSKSQLHDVGEKVINWVINGEKFLSSDVKSNLISNVVSIYNDNTDWYSKRLDAIDYYIQGDLHKAYDLEKEALKLAESSKIPEWIITNILIDLRNLENTYLIGKDFSDKESQKRLNNLESIVHVPIIDRYLESAYETLLNEEITRNTASIGTTFYGNKMDSIIIGVENYLFTALLYGSYTHLILTRKIFATIFYRTGKLYNNNVLLYNSVKMYLFSGQYKDFIRLSNFEWNNISDLMILNADEIWHQCQNIEEYNKDTIYIGALRRIGLYLNDRNFIEAEKYLLDLSHRLLWKDSDNYIDCLLNSYGRMDQTKIVEIIITIIESKNYITAHHLTRLISCIDIEYVPEKMLLHLCEVMRSHLSEIIERNGDPQCIAALVNTKPDIFSELEKISNNGLTGNDRLLYDLNTNKGNWRSLLISEIRTAKEQFEVNNQKGVYTEFSENPYDLISQAFNNMLSEDVIELVTTDFFPLCIDILDSNCNIKTKDQCAECLCIVLGYYKKHKIDIPNELINCINNVSMNISSVFSMGFSSKEGLRCRLITLKMIIGALEKQELISLCLSYSKKDVEERRALVECLKTYLQYSTDIAKDVDSLIVSIVFLCCEDEDFYIRTVACECLWYLLDSEFAEKAEEKIKQMILDPAPVIRNKLLSICEEDDYNHKSLINSIIKGLIQDANYMIRKRANKLLNMAL